MIDTLIERIKQTKNPTAVGLDTALDYLPERERAHVSSLKDAAEAITAYNYALIDALCTLVPAVKVQVAYYESYGVPGMQAFCDTLSYAHDKGLVTIADVKRNDIGSTAARYSAAYLGIVEIGDRMYTPFESDFITVNGYLGSDGLDPFLADCKAHNKGIFALVKTSNPSSGELQDLKTESGDTVYEQMAALLVKKGKALVGKYGYSSAGAVIGATHPEQAEKVRKRFPSLFFLIPGYGAQGGKADDLTVCFDERGLGGIVNNSRGIICAYKAEKYKGQSCTAAAKNAVLDMQADLSAALKRAGKEL